MGDMAEYYREQEMLDYYEQELERETRRMDLTRNKPARSKSLYKTENVLNRTNWVDGQGNIHELETMDRDHMQNVLYFLHKHRNRYWLNCNDVTMIDRFKDGDQFFQQVIRQSTIWNAIMEELKRSDIQGFNFTIKEEEK